MAMGNALSGLSGPAAISLAQAMSQLMTDHVDDDPPTALRFQNSVSRLADNARTFFSSCIGTGVADQYALALGYRFRCNSRELIPTGRAGDFIYDGPPVPTNSAVMIEAKGSLQANLNTAAFWRTVDQGYIGQVEPHIGQTYPLANGSGLTIVHGYAVGCAAQVPLVDAIGHVVETVSATGGSSPPGATVATGSSAQIALGNYQGIATLMGDDVLLRAIEDAKHGQRLKDRGRSPQTRRFTWRGESFFMFEGEESLAAVHPDDTGGYISRMPPPRFAMWGKVFLSLLSNLQRLPEVWTMPEVPAALRSNEFNDGGAVLPDGLALLPPWFEHEVLDRAPPLTVPLFPIVVEEPRGRYRILKKIKLIEKEKGVEQYDEPKFTHEE